MKWRTMIDEKTGKKDQREVVSQGSDKARRHQMFRIVCMLDFANIVIAIAAAVICFCGSRLESGCAYMIAALAWSHAYRERVFSGMLNDMADDSRSLARRCLDLVSRIFAGMAVAVVKSEEATEGNGGEDETAGKH